MFMRIDSGPTQTVKTKEKSKNIWKKNLVKLRNSFIINNIIIVPPSLSLFGFNIVEQ
jgi:hypothetical protein